MELISRLFKRTLPQPLSDESESRRERMEQRRRAMLEEMMANGTHLFAGKKYVPVLGKAVHEGN